MDSFRKLSFQEAALATPLASESLHTLALAGATWHAFDSHASAQSVMDRAELTQKLQQFRQPALETAEAGSPTTMEGNPILSNLAAESRRFTPRSTRPSRRGKLRSQAPPVHQAPPVKQKGHKKHSLAQHGAGNNEFAARNVPNAVSSQPSSASTHGLKGTCNCSSCGGATCPWQRPSTRSKEPPPASDEVWEKRFVTRLEAVNNLKASDEYKSNQHVGHPQRPLTPDYRRRSAKRNWEQDIGECRSAWRFLRGGLRLPTCLFKRAALTQDVRKLVEMGFDELPAATAWLQRGNVDQAIQVLLHGRCFI